jgi:hypothetical protein
MARCQRCKGARLIEEWTVRPWPALPFEVVPCPACGGSGMAQCQVCLGRPLYFDRSSRRLLFERIAGNELQVPCPNCGGSGIEHCCEGLRAPESQGKRRGSRIYGWETRAR